MCRAIAYGLPGGLKRASVDPPLWSCCACLHTAFIAGGLGAPGQLWPTHHPTSARTSFLGEKSETCSGGTKLDTDCRHTNFFLASGPPTTQRCVCRYTHHCCVGQPGTSIQLPLLSWARARSNSAWPSSPTVHSSPTLLPWSQPTNALEPCPIRPTLRGPTMCIPVSGTCRGQG